MSSNKKLTKNPRNGKKIDNSIDSTKLSILNSGINTQVDISPGSLSAIDLSNCTPSLLTNYTWEVINDLYEGDHFPILITHNNTIRCLHKTEPKWTQPTGVFS